MTEYIDMGKKHKKCPLGEVLGKGCSPDKKLEKSQISSKVLFPGNQWICAQDFDVEKCLKFIDNFQSLRVTV